MSNAAANPATTFARTDTKLLVPVVTLSTQDNAKLLQQLKWGFDPSFYGVNRLFVLPFNANDSRIGHSRYYLPIVKVKDYNVMIDGKNFFDQPIKSYIKAYENIGKRTTGQGDDYTTGYLPD